MQNDCLFNTVHQLCDWMGTHLSRVSANARTRSGGVWVEGRAPRLRLVAVIAVWKRLQSSSSASQVQFCVSTRTVERKGLRDISISQRRWQWVSHGAAPPPLRTNFPAFGARGCGRGYWPALEHHLKWRVNQLLTRFMVKNSLRENRHEKGYPNIVGSNSLHKVHELFLLWS